MKLVVGQEYSVCTGTISFPYKFLGIARSSFASRLLVFENPREDGGYKYLGVVVDVHFPHFAESEIEFTLQLRATHYGNSIKSLRPNGMEDEWYLT